MKRSYEILRHDSGKFFLRCENGLRNSRQIYDYDLAIEAEESKRMLLEILKKFRIEEIGEEERKSLVDSISDSIPIPKKPWLVTQAKNKLGELHGEGIPEYPPVSYTFKG